MIGYANVKPNFGEFVRRRRKQLGYSLAELADKAKSFNAATLAAWERGENRPSVRFINSLADVLEVKPDELLSSEMTSLSRDKYTTKIIMSTISTFQNRLIEKAEGEERVNSKIKAAIVKQCAEAKDALEKLAFIENLLDSNSSLLIP